MPRIPEDELERLKREVPLERLCGRYGIGLKAHGKDLIGHCPFHEDRTPSFVVSVDKNLWNCLGACGCGGDVIELVRKREKVSFRRACEILREMLGAAPAAVTYRTRVGSEHPILVDPARETRTRNSWRSSPAFTTRASSIIRRRWPTCRVADAFTRRR